MIAVIGATGNTGRKITQALLEAGEEVRVLGRSKTKLAEFKSAGAEVLTGDVGDGDFLNKALRGADAVYSLLPTDRRASDYQDRQRQQGEAIATALRECAISHVVALSSLGADQSGAMGLIDTLHEQEERLKRLERANVLLLRPASFFENFRDTLVPISQQGVSVDSVAPDLPIPMVATRDIADVAAGALRTRNFSGMMVRELLGPRDLSYADATRILGKCLGKPQVEYVQLSDAGMAWALMQAGFSESFANLYVQMTRAFNEGRVKPRKGRTSENTTPTPFEDFADELARSYRAAA